MLDQGNWLGQKVFVVLGLDSSQDVSNRRRHPDQTPV